MSTNFDMLFQIDRNIINGLGGKEIMAKVVGRNVVSIFPLKYSAHNNP